MKHPVHMILSSAVGSAVSLLVGCGSDGRLADLAEQVTHDQAVQNQRMAESSQSIAQGSQQLVAADAQARGELIELQHALRHDQAEIARQRDVLEVERAEIAHDRLTDSQLGGGLIALGLLLAALAPLVLAGLSLVGLWREPTPAEEGQILIEELALRLLPDAELERPRLPSSGDANGVSPADSPAE